MATAVAAGSSPLPPLPPPSSAGSGRTSKRLQEAAAAGGMGDPREKAARAEEGVGKEDGGHEGVGGEPKAKKARAGGGGQGPEQLSLAIQPPLPRFPFVNHFFDVHIRLFDEGNQIKAGGEELEAPLQVELLLDDKEADKRVPVPAGRAEQVLEVDPKEPRLGRNGKASFRVRIKDVSMTYDNRPMRLRVSAALPPKGGGGGGKGAAAAPFAIAAAVSGPMTVIRHRLRIRSETQPPTVWYKDEGGRDKCMEVMVDLVDSEGRRVHGQEVPLRVSLLYEDLHTVTKQDILRLSSDSRQAIDHTGTATLRLRIEDVSKNHQSKGFVVKVGPDTQLAPLNADISPDISTSVSVRSKRNRRSKHLSGGATTSSAAAMHHATAAGAGPGARVGGLVDDEVSLVGQALAAARPSVELAMPGVPHSILQDAAQLSMQAANAAAAATGAGAASSGAGVGAPSVEGAGAGREGPTGAVAAVAVGGAGPPVIRALGNVIAWTRAVVNGLYQIQWQLIGYESRPDGSPDISKPLFNIHNPNAVVTSILQSYRAETMDQLRFLVQALEQGQQGGGTAMAGQQQGNGSGEVYEGDPSAGVYGYGEQQQQQGGGARLPSMGLPPMLRSKSGLDGGGGGGGGGGELGGMLPLVRESTYDLLAGMDPSWFAEGEGGAAGPSPSVVAEASVQAVVAKEYASPTYGTLGFPAFDPKDALLGFFKEGRNEQGQTVAFFVPPPPGFAEEERRAVGAMLEREREGQDGDGAVMQLANEDLAQLKERVLMYHWSRGGAAGTGGGETLRL